VAILCGATRQRHLPTGRCHRSPDLEETGVMLITPAWPSATLGATTHLFIANPRGGAVLLTAGVPKPPPLPTPLDRLILGAVPFFASVYALVRGLDNVDALERWNRLRRVIRERFNI
jgi:hypothetical protein